MATRKVTKKTEPAKTVESKSVTTSSESKNKSRSKKLLIVAAIVVVIIFLFVFKNQFIVATVNGQPITRMQLISQLEKKDGKTVLESIITEQLILQEGKKKNINITNDNVNAEISNIEKSVSAQGQNIDTLLAQQGMTRSDLNQQVKIQLMLKKLVGAGTPVTDKDIDAYIEQNKEAMPTEITDTVKDQIKQQLEQQKLNEKIQTYVSNLQSKAKIDYLRKY